MLTRVSKLVYIFLVYMPFYSYLYIYIFLIIIIIFHNLVSYIGLVWIAVFLLCRKTEGVTLQE